ncbi:MAG: hypothetical protein ACR2JY_00635 [Chloroflexota bacterium]
MGRLRPATNAEGKRGCPAIPSDLYDQRVALSQNLGTLTARLPELLHEVIGQAGRRGGTALVEALLHG